VVDTGMNPFVVDKAKAGAAQPTVNEQLAV
jgi:hypothetical protein